MKKTYVYKGKEVELTGRMALANKDSIRSKPATKLVEIKPVGTENIILNEWVKFSDLFTIDEKELTDDDIIDCGSRW